MVPKDKTVDKYKRYKTLPFSSKQTSVILYDGTIQQLVSSPFLTQ